MSTEVTIDLLGLLQDGGDFGDDVTVEVGDLLNLEAQTGPLWLPAIFQRDSFEFLQEWANEVRAKLRAAGVHTTIISADVFDDDDDVRHLELELQVAFVGELPIQLDAQGEFYGYDEDGNLLTADQFWDQVIAEHSMQGGFAATVGRAPGWGVILGLVIAVAIPATLTLSYAILSKAVSPEAREPVREISDAVKTVSIAAAVLGLVYLLSKA